MRSYSKGTLEVVQVNRVLPLVIRALIERKPIEVSLKTG